MLKVVCAWCQPVMEFPGVDSEQVSHGICPPCYNNVMGNLGSASKAPKDRDGNAIGIDSDKLAKENFSEDAVKPFRDRDSFSI